MVGALSTWTEQGGRGPAQPTLAVILLKLMWGREDWIFNVSDTMRGCGVGGEKFQVPLENKEGKI